MDVSNGGVSTVCVDIFAKMWLIYTQLKGSEIPLVSVLHNMQNINTQWPLYYVRLLSFLLRHIGKWARYDIREGWYGPNIISRYFRVFSFDDMTKYRKSY